MPARASRRDGTAAALPSRADAPSPETHWTTAGASRATNLAHEHRFMRVNPRGTVTGRNATNHENGCGNIHFRATHPTPAALRRTRTRKTC